ncbi:hypothetical protein M8818_000839 [Zalaria obscura]|uniref:Uncharacterized protein n=1 Tax=Zalaria obscura TaxID=2024903 RepID=A0ACC3SQ37_9PEZI
MAARPSDPKALLWAYELKRQHTFLLERIDKLEASNQAYDAELKDVQLSTKSINAVDLAKLNARVGTVEQDSKNLRSRLNTSSEEHAEELTSRVEDVEKLKLRVKELEHGKKDVDQERKKAFNKEKALLKRIGDLEIARQSEREALQALETTVESLGVGLFERQMEHFARDMGEAHGNVMKLEGRVKTLESRLRGRITDSDSRHPTVESLKHRVAEKRAVPKAAPVPLNIPCPPVSHAPISSMSRSDWTSQKESDAIPHDSNTFRPPAAPKQLLQSKTSNNVRPLIASDGLTHYTNKVGIDFKPPPTKKRRIIEQPPDSQPRRSDRIAKKGEHSQVAGGPAKRPEPQRPATSYMPLTSGTLLSSTASATREVRPKNTEQAAPESSLGTTRGTGPRDTISPTVRAAAARSALLTRPATRPSTAQASSGRNGRAQKTQGENTAIFLNLVGYQPKVADATLSGLARRTDVSDSKASSLRPINVLQPGSLNMGTSTRSGSQPERPKATLQNKLVQDSARSIIEVTRSPEIAPLVQAGLPRRRKRRHISQPPSDLEE